LTDLNEITYRMAHWLAQHNLPAEGFSLVLEFPSDRAVNQAVMALRSELKPFQIDLSDARAADFPRAMNGIGLRFTHARKS
jgi:hypothetical protein